MNEIVTQIEKKNKNIINISATLKMYSGLILPWKKDLVVRIYSIFL